MDLLRCNDRFELLVLQAITQKVLALQDQREEALAIKISNAVVKAFGG